RNFGWREHYELIADSLNQAVARVLDAILHEEYGWKERRIRIDGQHDGAQQARSASEAHVNHGLDHGEQLLVVVNAYRANGLSFAGAGGRPRGCPHGIGHRVRLL